MLKKIHWTVGWLGIAAFPITGWWMQVHFPQAYQSDNGVRMMFRSDHVYIFISGLLNLLVGLYYADRPRPWQRKCQWIGSVLIFAGPPLFLAAFCVEPFRGMIPDPVAFSKASGLPLDFGLLIAERPWTLLAVVLLLDGTLLHFIASLGKPETEP